MSTPTDTTDTLGDLLETAKPLIMQGLSSLPNGEWIRLGDSDYEACQTSDVGVWLARWKVGRLAVSDCASDLVRVDLGLWCTTIFCPAPMYGYRLSTARANH